jgi:hypothetical protein
MQDINIPQLDDIANMSRERCERERLRLRNEISFARGNAMWGGPSAEELLEGLRLALERLEQRLSQVTMNSEMHYSV